MTETQEKQNYQAVPKESKPLTTASGQEIKGFTLAELEEFELAVRFDESRAIAGHITEKLTQVVKKLQAAEQQAAEQQAAEQKIFPSEEEMKSRMKPVLWVMGIIDDILDGNYA